MLIMSLKVLVDTKKQTKQIILYAVDQRCGFSRAFEGHSISPLYGNTPQSIEAIQYVVNNCKPGNTLHIINMIDYKVVREETHDNPHHSLIQSIGLMEHIS